MSTKLQAEKANIEIGSKLCSDSASFGSDYYTVERILDKGVFLRVPISEDPSYEIPVKWETLETFFFHYKEPLERELTDEEFLESLPSELSKCIALVKEYTELQHSMNLSSNPSILALGMELVKLKQKALLYGMDEEEWL